MKRLIPAILFVLTAAPAWASGVSPRPYTLVEADRFFGLPLTNTMITSWVVSLLLILFVRWLVAKPTLIPSRGQAVIESLIGGLREMLGPIVGKHAMPGVFPFLVILFFFILVHNWSGLLPGVGTFGFYDEKGKLIYWMRPGNTDLNMTIALAVISMGAWLFFCLKYAGVRVLMFDLFGNKADRKETPLLVYLGLIPIFAFVGIIEVVSIAFRPVALSLRLFGNMFGGENLLDGLMGFFITIPFYFFEFMVGGLQAFIFTILVAIYIGLICNHGDDEAHEH